MGEGKGCAKTWVRLPSHPPHIYRGKGEGGRPPQIQSEEGAAARGVALPPKARDAPPFRVPQTLGAWALGGGTQPTKGLVTTQLQPIRSFGAGGPSRWTPGTPPVVPVQYRYTPEYFR